MPNNRILPRRGDLAAAVSPVDSERSAYEGCRHHATERHCLACESTGVGILHASRRRAADSDCLTHREVTRSGLPGSLTAHDALTREVHKGRPMSQPRDPAATRRLRKSVVAVERVGACVMIAAFLVLALFG
jgi:hypothetical protein